MTEPRISGIERVLFGAVSRTDDDEWLDEHLGRHLGSGLAGVQFRAGRISAVYGVRTRDGRAVVLKVHRHGADTAHLAAAVLAQHRLADAGYPCPRPLHGPIGVRGRAVVIETMCSRRGEWGTPPRLRSGGLSPPASRCRWSCCARCLRSRCVPGRRHGRSTTEVPGRSHTTRSSTSAAHPTSTPGWTTSPPTPLPFCARVRAATSSGTATGTRECPHRRRARRTRWAGGVSGLRLGQPCRASGSGDRRSERGVAHDGRSRRQRRAYSGTGISVPCRLRACPPGTVSRR